VTTTTYTTVNGRILRQNKEGVVHNFVSDPLGSVVMVRDNSGNTAYEAEYDPYGNVQSETGTNPSEFGYVGTLGYVKDSAFSLYVRARYLLTNLGRWLTKDPLWPDESGFVYAGAAPSLLVDFYGLLQTTQSHLKKDKPVPIPGGWPGNKNCEREENCDKRRACCESYANAMKSFDDNWCMSVWAILASICLVACGGRSLACVLCLLSIPGYRACLERSLNDWGRRMDDCRTAFQMCKGWIKPRPFYVPGQDDHRFCPMPDPRPWTPPILQ